MSLRKSVVLILGLLTQPGCGPSLPSALPPTHPGGRLVIAIAEAPCGVNELLEPATNLLHELRGLFFLSLLQEQPDFDRHPPTFAPLLASSYEWSLDHKVLTFHLRDIAWSDGVPVTAEDVQWTWTAQVSPLVAWPGRASKSEITNVEVSNPHTVRFHFSHAYANQLLDANAGGVLPKHVWGQLAFQHWRKNAAWFQEHLVVDGPFTIQSWTPNQEIVLRRNGRYFAAPLPRLDEVVIRTNEDPAVILMELLTGAADFAPSVSPTDAKRIGNDNPDLAVIPYWFRTSVAVFWNNSHPLFADPEVRRALTLAIDRQTIVDTLLAKLGSVSSSPILDIVWAHNRRLVPWPYDPATSRRLLASHGWRPGSDGLLQRNGKHFAFTLETNAGNHLRSAAVEMVQAQLQQVGIQVQLRTAEFSALAARLRSGEYDAVLMGYALDSGLDLSEEFSSSTIGDSNYARYSNREVDALIKQANSQADILQAGTYLNRVQEILHQEQPWTFMWQAKRLSAANRRVRGIQPNVLLTLFNLEKWSMQSESGQPGSHRPSRVGADHGKRAQEGN
jgi:peptide/nickel transport system substrate-binding protein